MKGNGGIPEKDICASMIGTNSDSFEGPGLLVCQEYIHHIIYERALFVSVLFVYGYMKYGMVPTWIHFTVQLPSLIILANMKTITSIILATTTTTLS